MKGDLIGPYSTLLLNELNAREESKRNRINLSISILALFLSFYSVWLTYKAIRDSNDSIELSQSMLNLTKESLEISKKEMATQQEWMFKEIDHLRRLESRLIEKNKRP